MKDSYGGTTGNRTRIVREIIERIQKEAPQLHISAKFSFFDDPSGEFALQECTAICKELEKAGIGSLEILGGHSAKEKGTRFEACYLELGKAARSAVKTPLILTGNNHDLRSMNEILESEKIDLFAMSRPLIREPDLPNRWQNGDTTPARCVSCSMCYTTHGKRCIFNQ